jgi:tyrosine-specific transport protein
MVRESKLFRLWGAILLIAGTTVGGGMLALPVETARAGFWPSLILLLISCLFMMATGLLLAEVSLWMEEGAHMMSMASRLLGTPGKILCALLYLFMAYASLVAYTAGGGSILHNATRLVSQNPLSRPEACTYFALIFGAAVLLGARFIGRINAILVVGMVAAYIGLVDVGFTAVRPDLLGRASWSDSLMGLPLILTTFSYQMIVPSLTPYLNRDPKSLRLAIIIGILIPFIVYAIWQWIILGTVPLEGVNGLEEAYNHGLTAIEPLRAYVGHQKLSLLSEYFAFFAIVTSYLGIALGLFDFLADALQCRKKGWNKVGLGALIIIPSLICAIIFEKAFLFSLKISGGYGDAVLNGMIPVAMVWVGRYVKNIKGPYQVFGGKGFLICILVFALVVFTLQSMQLFTIG